MKKLILLILVNLAAFTHHLSSTSLAEYIQQNGMPTIEEDAQGYRYLDLSRKGLSDFVGLQSILNINQVHLLFLFGNQVQTLPETIFHDLYNLMSIDLGSNQLETLPAFIFHGLDNLQCIYLENNKLKTLPDTVFHGLHKLQTLYLYNNKLQTLPDTIFDNVQSLHTLDIEGNVFNLDFLPTLTNILHRISHLTQLNGKQKDQILRKVPFATLKQLTAEYIAKNIINYSQETLDQLPQEIRDFIQYYLSSQ